MQLLSELEIWNKTFLTFVSILLMACICDSSKNNKNSYSRKIKGLLSVLQGSGLDPSTYTN